MKVLFTVISLVLMLVAKDTLPQGTAKIEDNRLSGDSVSDGYRIVRRYQKTILCHPPPFFTKNLKPSFLTNFAGRKSEILIFMRQGDEDSVDVFLNNELKYSTYLQKDGSGEIINEPFKLKPLAKRTHGNFVTIKFKASKIFIRFEINNKYDFVALYVNARAKKINVNSRFYSKKFMIVSM